MISMVRWCRCHYNAMNGLTSSWGAAEAQLWWTLSARGRTLTFRGIHTVVVTLQAAFHALMTSCDDFRFLGLLTSWVTGHNLSMGR